MTAKLDKKYEKYMSFFKLSTKIETCLNFQKAQFFTNINGIPPHLHIKATQVSMAESDM